MMQLENPYKAGSPLRKEQDFFGRQDILDWVMRELRNQATSALVLSGQRRIGKTSLLLQLGHMLPPEFFIPIYFDLQDQATRPLGQVLADLVDTVVERVGLELPDLDASDNQGRFFQHDFLPQLYQALEWDRRLVFLLDEFDVLDQGDEAQLSHEAAAKALFPFLRRLMTTDPRLAFVFVIGRRAEDLSLDFATTFKSSLVKEIWLLDEESAEALVRQAEVNGTLSLTDQAVKRLLGLTSCHPYLTQLLCQRVWERAYAGGATIVPLIDVSEVEAAVPDALETGNNALVWLWEGLGPAEKIYAAALAEVANEGETISEDQVRQVLTTHAARLRARDVELAPDELIKRRVLEATGEREYRFAVELFRRWVRQNRTLGEVKDELDRVEPLAERPYVRGKGFFDRRQWKTAIRYFREALEANPHHFGARLRLGEALRELGQTDEAVVELEVAYGLDRVEARLPLARALVDRAKVLKENGDAASALEACERALEISPAETSARELRLAILRARWDEDAVPRRQYRRHLVGVLTAAFLILLMSILGINSFYFQPREDSVQTTTTAQANTLVAVELQLTHVAGTNVTTAQVDVSPTLTPTPTSTPKPILEIPVWAGTPMPQLIATISPANVNQITPLAQWGKGILTEIACSTDGTLLAVASSVGIYLYDTQTLDQVHSIKTESWVNSIAFSRDGVILAAGLSNGEVQLWQVEDREILARLGDRTSTVTSVALAPNSDYLAVGKGDIIRLWERVSSGDKWYWVELEELTGHDSEVNSVAFSPDGAKLASGSNDNTVRLWKVEDWTELGEPLEHAASVNSVAFSPVGETLMLASGSADGIVRLWQVEDGVLLDESLEERSNSVNALAFSPAGDVLVSVADNAIKEWWVEEGELRQISSSDEPASAHSVAFFPDGKQFVSAADDTVQLRQVGGMGVLHVLDGYTSKVNSVAFSPDGAMLAAGAEDGTVQLRRVADGTLLHTLNGHKHKVNSVAFSPDGTKLASGSTDNTVRLWLVQDGQELLGPFEHTGGVNSVAFSPDGATLASGSSDTTVRLWQVEDGKPLKILEGHKDWVISVAFSQDGATLASGSDDTTVRLWQVNNGELLHELKEHTIKVHSVAFSPNGTTLAAGAIDGTVWLWRVDGGRKISSISTESAAHSLVFSSDGMMLASASDDGIVRLWSVGNGEKLHELKGHMQLVTGVTFSPDGEMLASGSWDGTVRLWGVVED